MKEILKCSASLFGKLIIVNIMSFFLVISLSVLATAAFTQNIGYTAYGTLEGSSESVKLYDHYNADGEDTLRADYEAKGYTVTESKLRSEISATGNIVFLAVSQLCCFMLLASFIYPKLWDMGTKDSNLVHFKHKNEDTLKGLKAGLIAIIPSAAVLLFLAFTSSGISSKLPTVLYKFANSSLYTAVHLIVGNATTFGELSPLSFVWLFLLLAVVPLISFAAYFLGYRNISLGEKFIYKKSKADKT